MHKAIRSVGMVLILLASIQTVSGAEPETQTIQFDQVPFKASPDDVRGNTIFWNLITNKPSNLSMERSLRVVRIDLDGKGSHDLLGILSSNGYFCGHRQSQCALFAVVNRRLITFRCLAPIHEPIEVLATKTHGLRDIRWQPGCLLKYDGQQSYDTD